MRRLSALLAFLVCGQTALRAEQMVSDGIAVIVNDAIITYQDVRFFADAAAELVMRQFNNRPEMLQQKLDEVRADATEQLIERQLILADFKTAGYNFPESVIEDAVQERIKQRYHDRAELMQSLKAQGITFETFRQQRREEIIIEAMRRKNLSPDILISPQRILNYYEEHKTNFALADQVKLRMIVLNKPSSDTGSTRELAKEIVRKLDEGASFKEMAKIYSDGAQRNNEGDWGWADRTMLRKELAEVAFSLDPGKRSGVVDLNDSCWIIQVEDKRAAHIRPLSEIRDEIERTLKQAESERMRKKWVTRLKEKAFVRYF